MASPRAEVIAQEKGTVSTPWPDVELLYFQVRKIALSLPKVVEGSKFGGDAWFIGKRFFAHCHLGKQGVYLEVILDKQEVKSRLPRGVIPHPQYAGYGWVRLAVKSEADLQRARALLRRSYRYMTLFRKVWLPKQRKFLEKIYKQSKSLPGITIVAKPEPGRKRIAVIVSPKDLNDPHGAAKVEAAITQLKKAFSTAGKRR